jgi:hypothetical protein
MTARITLTIVFVLCALAGVGCAFMFSMDAEGRGGNYILAGLGAALIALIAIVPTWTLFR